MTSLKYLLYIYKPVIVKNMNIVMCDYHQNILLYLHCEQNLSQVPILYIECNPFIIIHNIIDIYTISNVCMYVHVHVCEYM